MSKGYYDFIEIGTSDFDTLIEEADNNTKGISIEPLKFYLDRLPSKANVVKYQAAVSDLDGSMDIYYIEEEKIKEHKLPWWVRGSNSVGRPHPFTVQEIGEELYNKLVTIDKVPTVSWKTLIKEFKIKKIKYLKVDTEGYDTVILNAYLDACEKNPDLYAEKIKFECHDGVSNIEDIRKLLLRFKSYHVEIRGTDIILVKNIIPRIIHQTYKTGELPLEIATTVNKLKSMNPTFEYRFYDDQDCINFIKDNYDQETLNLYLSIDSNYGSARADLFRYLLMYKVGGVYLDIKSCTTIPLEHTLLITDEYLLTHWPGRDWAEELNYKHGEFQNWHIICKPGHPFLEKVIETVKDNIKRYNGEVGKEAVLRTTGPIAYSKAILTLLNKHRVFKQDSPVREYKLEEEIGLCYMDTNSHHHSLYKNGYPKDKPLVSLKNKHRRAYILYANETYYNTIKSCVKSIRKYSKLPVYVYMLNSDLKVNLEGVTTVKWSCDLDAEEDRMYKEKGTTFYINRSSKKIYKILIQRPAVTKHVLENYAETVAYIDCDSVATPNIEKIFDYYDTSVTYPYFVEGTYDWLQVNGRGGAESRDDLSTTLEHPACELFNVNQYVRGRYRQTGYYVAGQKCIDFLEEWYWMCTNPKIIKNIDYYAPYNEETIANVLLWKYNAHNGLPYIYVNGGINNVEDIYTKVEFTGKTYHLEEWYKIPAQKEDLLFFHGEKLSKVMDKMSQKIGEFNGRTSKKLLYVAPHLSTGGQPQYLLKQIKHFISEFEIYVAEYNFVSNEYTVQREQIRELLGDKFYVVGEEKERLISIIEEVQPDIVHLHEVPEFFMSDEVAVQLFGKADRDYFIITTTHSSNTTPSALKYHADKFVLASKWSQNKFTEQLPEIPNDIWEYPVESYSRDQKAAQIKLGLDPSYKHVLMVGLFTPGKNQGEIFEIAKGLQDKKIKFHFVGNRAINFKDYWEPLMSVKPDNCIVWGERNDVNTFYEACDLFYFSSKFELNPLSVKEALSYGLPCIFRRLETYLDSYEGNSLVTYIDNDLEKTKQILLHDLR